jgi:hypothetical protein
VCVASLPRPIKGQIPKRLGRHDRLRFCEPLTGLS